MGAFKSGFIGCFGVLAAIMVVIIGLILLGQCSAHRSGGADTSMSDSHFLSACAAALTKAGHLAPDIEGADLGLAAPAILSAGETGTTPRIQCGITRGSQLGAVTADVRCDASEPNCVSVVAVVLDGRLLYADAAARKAARRRAGR